MIDPGERAKMLKAYSIGPRMIAYLERIGIERLADLKGADPNLVAMRIDVALERRHMNRLGIAALANLIELADRESDLGPDIRSHTSGF
ncbi:hypothetical protein ACSBOB_07925 [Mesorhizobium sp. ASY16-5R]|uniref:hypothetical protein n=1 Tax=Mesorhizobium sp. ASY16-5R TaxID=3445772 RepID=UPI003FA17356